MSEINELITRHWRARAALEAAKNEEAEARRLLSEALCSNDEGLKNKTLALSGGYKLRHEVQRTLRVDKNHADYKSLPTLLKPELLNKLVRQKQELSFSYSTFNSLPDELKQKLIPFMTVVESVAIKYDQTTDNR